MGWIGFLNCFIGFGGEDLWFKEKVLNFEDKSRNIEICIILEIIGEIVCGYGIWYVWEYFRLLV